MVKSDRSPHMPSREEILDFLRTQNGKNSKREIARAFKVTGPDKVLLKKLLREMTEEGLIAKDVGRSLRPADQLPDVIVAEFAGTTRDGEPIMNPVGEQPVGENAPLIYLNEKRSRNGPAMGAGDRALVRLSRLKQDPPTYKATVIKHLSRGPQSMLGVFHSSHGGGRVTPVERKNRDEWLVDSKDTNGAKDGELVLIEPIAQNKRSQQHGRKKAQVKERLGDITAPKSISLIAIHAHGIPTDFPSEANKMAEAAKPVTLKDRTDMREINLITIDPSDARDHDDAIYAEPDSDPANSGGWHLIVAIADVSHYVRPNSALDKEAYKRGNSCYFPDRVVPMLPEALSNGLCSLKPNEDRACMAVHIWIDAKGKKLRHKFVRGLMRSRANISYADAQSALNGRPNDNSGMWVEPVLKPLHAAWKALMIARDKRQPLELDLPERKIILGDDGVIASIQLRERFDTHKIVEEFMISANVCAAEELEKQHMPALYRIHDVPPMDKLEALREFLRSLDLSLTKGQVMRPHLFNGILAKVKDSDTEHLVNQVILRSQTQAYYTPDNVGHFGLALMRYAHFTSPIRRYADLIVHRGLIRGLKLGNDGLSDENMQMLSEIGEHISSTERRAMTAERDSTDRYMAAYLSGQLGDVFTGRIRGVTRFGLFVELEPTGADGLVPISTLVHDYYRHDEVIHALVGERTGHTYKLGDRLEVKLTEANKYSGGLKLEVVGGDNMPDFIRRPKAKKHHRGKHKAGKRGGKKPSHNQKPPRHRG